ncbi:LppP/LprE family lipoprotein [Umezawaea beigongshangensis]|uniref:LppP/LprE family lipoprotein n=1 Tax=Umezawaea beigongshangensis TaxID=2780383 RepID=UPI0018F21808|nr:LppP/LprE family lipoprotein [Umezawaea beigongshangensis]
MTSCQFCGEPVQDAVEHRQWCADDAGAHHDALGPVVVLIAGAVVGLAPLLPWARVGPIGDLDLHQLYTAQRGAAFPLIFAVIAVAAVVVAVVGAPRTTARIATGVLALLTCVLVVRLLLSVRDVESLSVGAGPWVGLAGALTLLVAAAVPFWPGPSTSQERLHRGIAGATVALVVIGAGAAGLAEEAPSQRPLAGAPAPAFTAAAAVPSATTGVVVPSTTTVSARPSSAGTGPSRTAAEDLVRSKGFTPAPGTWSDPSALNVVLAGRAGAADSASQLAFFFHDGDYLGTDTATTSARIDLVRAERDTIVLSYQLYAAADPVCCPTRGSATVRYRWTGTALAPLDPIPTDDPSADGSRR